MGSLKKEEQDVTAQTVFTHSTVFCAGLSQRTFRIPAPYEDTVS